MINLVIHLQDAPIYLELVGCPSNHLYLAAPVLGPSRHGVLRIHLERKRISSFQLSVVRKNNKGGGT